MSIEKMLLSSKNYCIKLLINGDGSNKPFFYIFFALLLYNLKTEFFLSHTHTCECFLSLTHTPLFSIFRFYVLFQNYQWELIICKLIGCYSQCKVFSIHNHYLLYINVQYPDFIACVTVRKMTGGILLSAPLE